MPLPRIVRRLLWVWVFFGVLLLVALFMGIFAPQVVVPEGVESIVLIDPTGTRIVLDVEVADAPDEWQIGLMNRPEVTRGMLFVFPEDAFQSFWMKNTLVPLDIAYFRADGTWVSSARMEPCATDPCETYPSSGPAAYALELPAGGIGQGIGSGWTMDTSIVN